MISDASARSLDNAFLNLFSKIDLVLIFQVVLSLMALLFAYDAIAGDWESGTLRLVISHPVRRGAILFAKYIGAMVCLLIPVLMSLLMVMILLSSTSSIQLDGEDFLRIGGNSFDDEHLPVCILLDRTADFGNNAPDCYIVDALYVSMGSFWCSSIRTGADLPSLPVGDTRAIHSSADQQIEQIWEEG